MKISKLLNKISLSIIFSFLLLSNNVIAEETPVDIWNIDKKDIEKNFNRKFNFNRRNYRK